MEFGARDMEFPPLAPTLGPLMTQTAWLAREAFDWLTKNRFRFVQLSAAQPGLRPRELDQSARRDLLATLRRHELTPAGVDVWIPVSHFSDSARVDHAVEAMQSAIRLAADLGRVPVSLTLPEDERISGVIVEFASHQGVPVADHHAPVRSTEGAGVGIDPAAWLSQNLDSAKAVRANASRLVSARVCDLLVSGLRGPIGDAQEGRLDVMQYQVALSLARYHKPVVADARQWRDVVDGLLQTQVTWSERG